MTIASQGFPAHAANPTQTATASATAPQAIRPIELSPHAPALDREAQVLLHDSHPLHHIKTQVQVCVGQATLTVGELLGAKEHQVLPLDRTLDQPVDLMIEGKVVARGQLVALDGHFAVRISELPQPLALSAQP